MPPKRLRDSEAADTAVHSKTKRRRKNAPQSQQTTRKTSKPPRKEKVMPVFFGEIIDEINLHGSTEYKVRWEPSWVATSLPVGAEGAIDAGGVTETGKVLRRGGPKALVEWADTLVAEEDVAVEELEKWKQRQAAQAVYSVPSSPGAPADNMAATSAGLAGGGEPTYDDELEKTIAEREKTPQQSTDAIVAATDVASTQEPPSHASDRREPLRQLESTHPTQPRPSSKSGTPQEPSPSRSHAPTHVTTPTRSDPDPRNDGECSNLADMPSPIVGESSRTPAAKLRNIQSAKRFGQAVTRLLETLSPSKVY